MVTQRFLAAFCFLLLPLGTAAGQNIEVSAEETAVLPILDSFLPENGGILLNEDNHQVENNGVSVKNDAILPEEGLYPPEDSAILSKQNDTSLNIEKNAPPVNEKSAETIIPPPESDFLTQDALNQPLTRHYITRYTSPGGLSWINSVIKNASVYVPFIKGEIAKRGLPPELLYLPFVESGYIGTARSKSGASGLWQFMMNSIAPFGLTVNEMIDERRDFRKATAAALQKLAENYDILGNWPMALAAYNAGLGGVSRAARRSGTDDYWILSERKELKTETIHYVPKLMAIAYIVSSPHLYGVDKWHEGEDWAVINPSRPASLDFIAAETGIDRNLLYRLNPELLYGITPPDAQYELKVPLPQAEIVEAILSKEDSVFLHYHHYQVRYGDTLSALSRHYGVSISLIEQYNPGISSRYLKIGENVIIPAFGDVTPYAGEQDTATAGEPVFFEGTHTVKKGETVWSLARRFNIDPHVLARENGMNLDTILSIGKILKVPIIENEDKNIQNGVW